MAAIADTSQRSVIGTCNSNQDPMRSAGRHERRASHQVRIRYHASGIPQGRERPRVWLLLRDKLYHSKVEKVELENIRQKRTCG